MLHFFAESHEFLLHPPELFSASLLLTTFIQSTLFRRATLLLSGLFVTSSLGSFSLCRGLRLRGFFVSQSRLNGGSQE
jgi:hypothetical protein